MRNPFNWVGNKYNYLHYVNEILKNKKYDTVHELFMGSGNILVNLECQADIYVGNDIIPLLPKLYNVISKESTSFTIAELEEIINEWDRFSDKKDYYDFRDYWNKKYLSNNYDKKFVYETILLLKMCSNSMVRFNRKEGYFNQGFRGVGKGKTEFFSSTAKSNIIKSLNDFKINLSKKRYKFESKDFKQLMILADKDDLVILDPPYILSDGMYGTEFTKKDDQAIFDFLKSTKADFVLFNYLSSGDKDNIALKDFISSQRNVNVEIINKKDSTGQGRSSGKEVTEVMVYRISSK